MATRIVIADESDLVLLGIQCVLEKQTGYEVVGKAFNLTDLQAVAFGTQPEVILYSDSFFGSEPLNVCRQIEETVPNAAVLVIGAFSDGMIIHNLFSRGVKGYLYRCDPLADTLPLALTAILKGRLYLSPTANAAYLVSIQGGQYARQLDDEARTVLQLLAEGCTVGEIAFQIRRSPRRVYWVRQKLRNWLGAATNEHLIQRAVEEGFICPVT